MPIDPSVVMRNRSAGVAEGIASLGESTGQASNALFRLQRTRDKELREAATREAGNNFTVENARIFSALKQRNDPENLEQEYATQSESVISEILKTVPEENRGLVEQQLRNEQANTHANVLGLSANMASQRNVRATEAAIDIAIEKGDRDSANSLIDSCSALTDSEKELSKRKAGAKFDKDDFNKLLAEDPNEALKQLGSYKNLSESDKFNLSQDASRLLNKKRIETGEILLGKQFLGTVVTDDEIDDYYKKGYVNLSQAIRIKENNKARIKNTPPVYNDETYGMLDGLITDYNPEADSNGDKAAYVTNEIAASDLPDAYKKKLQERFKNKGDAVNDSEKRRVSGMQDFARKEVDRLMNSGVFGDYKGNDLKLLTGEGNFDLDASYKKSPGYEEAILKASKITQDVDEFIRSNPSAGQEQIKEYIKTRSDEMKPSKTIDISTKKAPVSFTGSMPTSLGLTPKESGAALRDAMNSMDMNTPMTKAPSMMDIIVSQEARRDDNGNLMVYNLPAEDGGGSYEVAGINEKHNPKMAAELANYVRTGNHKEAEKKTREYTEELTRRPAELMKEAGIKSAPVETFLRDSFHNMGEGGMARVIQRATGSPASGKMDDATVKALGNLVKDNGNVGAISALNKARQEHYLAIVKSKPEKEIFKDGWLDRSNRVAGLALNVADYDFKGTDWATVRSGLITEGAKMKMSYRQILAAVGQARQNWLVSNSPFNL